MYVFVLRTPCQCLHIVCLSPLLMNEMECQQLSCFSNCFSCCLKRSAPLEMMSLALRVSLLVYVPHIEAFTTNRQTQTQSKKPLAKAKAIAKAL